MYISTIKEKGATQLIMSPTDNNSQPSACANCGKGGEEASMNACNKCDLVVYCNAACKKKHRSKHKKECKKRAAELHDIELFKLPSPPEDCPICMLPLPSMDTGHKYYSCCGKEICSGCIHAVAIRDKVEQKCPFCRTPAPNSDKEIFGQLNKRIEVGDAGAMFSLGCCYREGIYGLPQDYEKALELYHRAGELGCARAYFNIGNSYYNGEGVERDNKKANHYDELAAMRGSPEARYNLGVEEKRKGFMKRALKHALIATVSGYKKSLDIIQIMYKDGDVSKDDYTKALRAYQAYLSEIKSDHGDEAAIFDEVVYKYC